MPKRKQGEVDNQGVQDFELIELLIREKAEVSQPGPSTSAPKGSDFESFKARFQSYVDQVPSYLHSVGKEGFFPHFFLGSFSALVDTEIATKLNIEKVYFSFDSAKTLKVAVIKKGEIKSPEDATDKVRLFVIAESGSTKKKFSYGELDKILGNTKVARNNVVRLARDQGKLGVRLVEITKEKDAKGKMAGISVNVESNKLDNDASTTHEFKEIKKGVWNNPESDIAKLTNSNVEEVEKSLDEVLKKVSKIHSEYKDSLVYGKEVREAAHHGFVAGALVNFRYRYNLRVYLEQFAGRGYADIVLVPRGKDRSLNAVPIIIELKAATKEELKELEKGGKVKDGSQTTPAIALEQAKDYAKGFQPNTMRVLTVSDNVLCVGLNLDSAEGEKFSMHISPPADRKPARPTIQKLLEVTSSWSGEESAIADLKKEIKQPLERIYHTFPGTPEKGGNYFSRFMLGQLLLANEFKRVDLKRFIFLYDEYSLDSTTKSGKPVTTFTLVRGGRNEEVFIFHIREGGRGDRSSKKILMPDRLTEQSKITEVYISLSEQKKSDFFNIEEVNRYDSLSEYKKGKDFFKGKLKEVPYLNGLREAFDEAFKSQITPAAGKVLSVDKYDSLTKKVGEGMFSFKDFIGEEAHFQGVLHGAFSYYSDLKLKESPRALILTEFQTGRGKRIDMVVHGISTDKDGNAKEYDPVGLELKGPREGKTANALKDEANEQITDEYTKGVTYKTLTDGKEVDFVGVVFDKGANNADSLILMSKDEFASVKVVHSSIFSISQQQCSKGRKQRSTGMACIDSFDEEKITEEEKEQRIKELFNADKVAEKVKNIEFYDQLFKFSQQISEGEVMDKNVKEAFVAKIKDVDLNSIDPEIRDIVKEMKDNIENKEEVKNILRRSGVAEKIGKVAEGAGLAFTAFLVGKHIANGDIEGLGYDALNLWVMPKIGEKISEKMLELGTKLDSQMLKGFAPVMGRAIGNFAAFLGLAESIKARQNATDLVDIKIADLNIATNSIFIAADVPAVVTETMSAIGMEAGVIGEFAGPVGAAISVAVIIIAQFVEAGLAVEKLEEHIKLTDQEKHDLYWDFFLDKKVPDYIGNDLQAEEIYKQYISKILDQFKGSYDKIAISLPSILLTEEKYLDGSIFRRKREVMQSDDASAYLGITPCFRHTRIVDNKFDFRLITRVSDISLNVKSGNNHISRLLPSTMKNYSAICGPKGDDVDLTVISEKTLQRVEGVAQCGYRSEYENMVLSTTVKKVSLKEYLPDCQNAILYSKSSSSRLPANMLFYIPNNDAFINVTSNYAIDVIFNGKNILLNSYGIDNQGSSVQNRYYFTDQLSNCDIHKQGTNFFYIAKDNFVCNLGIKGQENIVVTQGNFTDSENIHSIIGSDKANYIEVSYAGYVDGKGGNDVITAKNFTAIKGYFGDSIYGKGLVLLPINFSDIVSMTHANNITNIYNKSGAFISVDKQTSVKTADGLFVTPTKVDMNTDRVTNVHITKLDNKLDNLRKMDNSNFNVTKQLLNTNYHGVVGSSSNHIFYPDEEHNNFYWKAPSNISHLYLFDNRNANIMIAQANGILDFSLLNSTLNDMPFIEDNKGGIKINKNGLNVTLLSNYKDVTVTFNGEEYYKLHNGELERDYCSHSLKVDGRFSVNGTNLLNHHNCFTFDSEKVLFLKLNNDLLLLSDRGALSISDYYSSVHKNWDLSIGLNNRIMEPEEFGERADEFSSFRYYKPDEQGLQIYHNQPINKNDIGLVDLKGKSILDFDMKVMNDTLLLSHKNNTLVKLENWNTYQPAREMIFAFNDTIVSNSKCIVSTCNSEDVVMEFNKEKFVLSTEQLFDAVKQNNLSKVKNLLSMGADVNIRDKRNWTPLHCAADNDNKLDISRAILNRNADIEARTNIGETPLHIANAYGQLKIIEFLIDKGANIEAKTNDDLTPLHVAIQHNNTTPKIIEFLLNKGVNVEAKTKDDWTSLHYAVSKSRLDIVKVLLSRGANIEAKNKDRKTPLDLALQENYADIVGFLKQTQLDRKLLTATENGDLFKVREFVSQGANVNAKDVGIFGRKPIHIAAENNNKNIIEFLLGNGVSVDDTSNYGWTPLHYAASKGCLEVAKFLIEKGADINAENMYGKKPIHRAAEDNHKNIIELLLGKGVSVNDTDKDGRTPLHWASWNGNLDVVKYLIGKGASINAKDKDSKTPLDIARDKGHSDIVAFLQQTQLDNQLLTAVQSDDLNEVKDLIARGASLEAKDKNGSTPLHYAAWNGQLGVVMYLVENGANLEAKNHYGRTALHDASLNNHLDIVEYLVKKGVGINTTDENGWTSLHWAASKGYLEVAKFLIEKGASINAQEEGIYGRKPIHVAAGDNNKNIIELLLSKGVSVDDTERVGNTPLYYAAWKGRLEAAEFLVDRGANINAADNSGKKPVHVAAENNNKNIIEFFLSKGVSVDEADKNGWTPLHWATLKDRLEIAEFLVDKGANINAEDVYGKKPIHRAATVGYRNIIEFLLSKGVSVDEIDNGWTRTPLHWASDGGYLDVVKYLVGKGANINAEDKDGKTSSDVARGEGHRDTAQYLEERSRDYARGKKAMHFAAENNDMENLRFLVSKGENVNDCGDDYWRPLHYAAKAGSLEAAKFLVENGAGFYSKKYETTDGQAPIHIAAYYGHKSIVKFFVVEKGVDINWEDSYRSHGNWWTPLHWASKGGHLDIVEYLVSLGANIDAKDWYSKTSIDIARGEGHTDIIQYLEERSRDYARGKKAMHFAAENNDMENLRFLVSKGENVNDCGDDYWRPLHYAAKAGSLEAAKFLVENGAGFYSEKYETTDGQAPIHIAAYYGHKSIVKFFVVEKGVDINWEDSYRSHGNWWTPLHWASKGGHLDIVEYLVSLGANIDAKDWYSKTSIDIARGEGHTDIIQYLEERSRDYARGKKAMHFAAENNDMENLRFLVSKGENVNDCGDDYWRPLHYAAKAGSLEAAKFLVENGAGFYSKKYETTDGQAPIHIAAYYGHKSIVKFFVVEKGVDVNWEDSYRSHGNWWTPLHWASKGGHLDIVEYLVSLGANIDAKDWYSKTSIDIAIDQKYDNIVEYLKKIKEEREKPVQRNRRRLLSESLDSSDQPEVAASSGTRPSSWINVFVDAVKGISRFVYFPLKVELPEIPENGSDHSDTARNSSNQNTNQFSSEVCVSNNVGLAFFLLQSFLDKKYPLPNLCSVTPEEALADTLNIVGEFEKTLEKTAKQSGVSVKGFDFFKVYLDIAGHVRNERYSQIPNTLYSIAKEACPKNEKFLSILKGNIEKMFNEQQIVNSGYQPNYIADSKPRSYLSNTTVDKHLQRSYHAISS